MKRSFALTCAISLIASLGLAAVEVPVLSYQQWKSARAEEARAVLDRLQAESQLDKSDQVERAPGLRPSGEQQNGTEVGDGSLVRPGSTAKSSRESGLRRQKSARVDQRIQQARLNVEIAAELSVNDYFVLYLSQQLGPEAIREATKKLTPDEVADLLQAYKKHLFSSVSPGVADGPGIGADLIVSRASSPNASGHSRQNSAASGIGP